MASTENQTIYIYLAKRDKTSVKIMIVGSGKKVMASRLENVELLNLPSDVSNALTQQIYDNRMLWEPWIESASTYEDLRNALKDRGYNNIPTSSQPSISNKVTVGKINTNFLPQRISMIRKLT